MLSDVPRSLIHSCEIGPKTGEDLADAGLGLCCHQCQASLDFCQPSSQQPDELLGICQDCGAWHYVAYLAEQAGILIAFLPVQTLQPAAHKPCIGVVGDNPVERTPQSQVWPA